MNFMKGKRILVTGVINSRSIAYGIANTLKKYGSEIILTYKEEKMKSKIEKISKEIGTVATFQCDVSSDESIKNCFSLISDIWRKFDGLVHSIAYAPSNQLIGDYLSSVDRNGFNISHEISSYSFTALVKNCSEMLNKNSSLLTITYVGSKRAMSNYNVMGLAKASLESSVRYMAYSLGPRSIRVNGISSGPIITASSLGIKNFKKMFHNFSKTSFIQRTIRLEEIGNCAAFLCSDLSSGITGEIINVDGGFSHSIPSRYFL
ncbi:enoyl-ACP reductase [Candidatus Riesia sp. GBBU]|nr:enoyl-ACP reductase [Candidatus Riesia sp. GBBU]